MTKVVIVCTGNTCRSPMAEAIFKDLINDKGQANEILVSSAGIYAFDGDGASPQAIEVMKKEYGIDLIKHRARVLDGSDIEDADIILVMTKHHKQMILDIYPEAVSKVHLLKEYAGSEGYTDIIDPFGQDYNTYKKCANELEESILDVIDRIITGQIQL